MGKSKILELLERQVPEFEYGDLGSDDVSIVFVFFIGFVMENIKNQELLERIIKLLEEIYSNHIEEEMYLLDDFAISLYDCGCYSEVIPKLSKELREYFELNIERWKKGNNIV